METKQVKPKRYKKLLTSKLLWVAVILIGGGVAYANLKPAPQPEYTTQAAEVTNLEQTVSVTGSVQGAEEIELNFEASGIIAKINVAKGDMVEEGEVLAQLSATNQYNAVLEALANLQASQAALDKLIAGASAEDIAVSEESVKSAEVTYNNRVIDLETLKSKLVADENSYRDAITNKETDLTNQRDTVLSTLSNELFDADTALDRIQDIFDDDDATYILGAKNIALKLQAETNHSSAISLVATANSTLTNAEITLSDTDINQALTASLTALTQVANALSNMYSVLINTPASTTYTQTEIDTDKSSISTHQTTIAASISSVQSAKTVWDTAKSNLNVAQNNLSTFLASRDSQIATAEGAVASAKSSWDLAKAQLEFKKAPTRTEDISLQRAKVAQAQAAVSRAQATLDQMTIVAPVNGLVTRVEYEIGEKPDLTKPVIAILGQSGLEIEVDIPESDIAKVAVGQEAMITLDAFGEDRKFVGHVTFIDPAETVIQDVVYYKVKVTFDDGDGEIKPGMTANIDIITAQKTDVLVVPVRAVKENGGKYVELLIDGAPEKRNVETGIRGDGGVIEILSGLEAGDQVITFIKEP